LRAGFDKPYRSGFLDTGHRSQFSINPVRVVMGNTLSSSVQSQQPRDIVVGITGGPLLKVNLRGVTASDTVAVAATVPSGVGVGFFY
jgi:hypothetical protein